MSQQLTRERIIQDLLVISAIIHEDEREAFIKDYFRFKSLDKAFNRHRRLKGYDDTTKLIYKIKHKKKGKKK